MKKIILLSLALNFICLNSQAQLRFDILGGVHSYDLSVNDFDAFKAGIKESSYGIHLGARLHAEIGSLYIEPGVMLNNISAKYTVDNPDTPTVESSNLNFDIPVVLGLDFKILHIFAGPVAHIRFNNYEELKDIGGYEEKASSAFFGAHIGAGLIFNNIGIDLRYEKNFADEEFGAESLFNQIRIVDTNSRIMASIFLRFGGGE